MRRTGANRAPAGDSQLEQYQVWTRTQGHLQKFMAARAEDNTIEKVTKVNKYIGKFPTSEDMIKSAEMLDQYKPLRAKLAEGLESTRVAAEKETKTLDEALELLSVLIALRRPADSGASGENSKRTKLRLTTRSSERIPLREGRRVAFRPPKSEQWILGLVKRQFMDNGRQMYEIQDADTEEPGPPFMTDIRSLIPLPDPDAPVGSPAHISSYPEFAKGTEVMAIYESTTSFYRAQVVAGPKDPWQGGRTVKKEPQYKLQFEDDEGRVQSIPAFDVVEWPGSGKTGSGSNN
ncbi:hypothetical protein OPQ81_011386 [Rhizoctonia solani]|nr:hypothetical protein OPQ81_011386 [Rhizoctonia solani]